MDHLIEPETTDEQIERELTTELRHTIDGRVRDTLIENAPAGRYRMAMLSCLTGRWDDLTKDVRRGKISKDDAHKIVSEIFRARLINELLASEMHDRVLRTDTETCETCKSWHSGRCPELSRICGMWFDLPVYSNFGCNRWEEKSPVIGWSAGE